MIATSSVSTLSHNLAFAVFLCGAFAMCLFMMGAAYFLGSRATGKRKNDPFESGMLPVGSAKLRFSAKFYLVAMLFVIFDVEVLYLYAWSVSVREAGWFGFVGAAIFIVILFVGLVYEGASGALDWSPTAKRKRQSKLEAANR